MTRCNVVSWVVLGEDSYIMHMEAVVMMWDDFSKAGWLPREVAQSCPTLCNPMNCSLPGSSIHRIFQARILEWDAFPSPMHDSESEAAQLCPTLSDPMDCSLPGSSIHRIFQARLLEWGAISFPRESFQPWDRTRIAGRHFTHWATREAQKDNSRD